MRRERQNKVHEGMERKEETQESEGEKDYFWSCCTFVQTFDEQQRSSTTAVFSFHFKVTVMQQRTKPPSLFTWKQHLTDSVLR